MTNPLNNLNKYPRRPFREKGFTSVNTKLSNTNNFHMPTLKDLDISLSDSEFTDLIEDVTTEMASKNLSKYSSGLLNIIKTDKAHSARRDSSECEPISKDYDIISKLLARIKSLELSNRYHEKDIREKNLRIKVLEEKCNLYRTAQVIKDVKYDRLKEIEDKCAELSNQIGEMENFLADYGLIWVGDKSFQSEPQSEEIHSTDYNPNIWPHKAASGGFVVDYDKLFNNINELNLMMNSEETKIAMTAPQRVELKKQEAVPITFYSNGICLFSGPFRPFSDESTRQVINDIDDGYFPSELEGRFPTGVPINAIDRRNIMYDVKPMNIFQGLGRTLGGNSSVSKLTGLLTTEIQDDGERYNQPYTGVLTSDASTQLTMEQFLNKLPQSTIAKNGKIFAIRNSIREIIENKVVTTSVAPPRDIGSVDQSLGNVAKIKIRSLHGDRVFHLALNGTDLVSDLYRKFYDLSHLDKDNYVLVISYPTRRILSDLNQTIEECGLMPTASLHIEPLVVN